MKILGSSRNGLSLWFYFLSLSVCLYGLFLAWWVHPRLVFYQQEPAFLLGRDFFDRFSYPGGPADWLSALLTFLCAWRWAGALLVAALAVGIAFFVGRIGRGGLWSFPFTLSLLTPLWVRYTIPLTVAIGLFFSVLGAWIYQRIARFPFGVRLGGFAILYAGLYLGTGGMALFFGLLALSIEALSSRSGRSRIGLGVAALVWIVLFTSLVDPVVWFLPPRQTILAPFALGKKSPFRWEVSVALGGIWVVFFLSKWLRGVFERLIPRFRMPGIVGVMLLGALLPLGVMGFTVDGKTKSRLLVRMAAAEGRWEALLAEIRRHPDVDRLSAFHMHRALYHLGRMGDLMFRYPQVWGVEGLIPLKEGALRVAMDYSDFWMELGHVNAAEHWAYEALTQKGETPRVLKRLGEVHLIEGNTAMVSTVQGLIQRVPCSGRWVQTLPWRSGDPDSTRRWVERIRKRGVDTDFLVHLNLPELDLVSLLRRNPGNRMAWEYLMAYHLLSGRLEGFLQELGRAPSFGLDRLPVHWEEALILLWRHSGAAEPVFAGFRFREETLMRFRAFEAILARHGGKPGPAHLELRRRFGGTYWYYALYRDPGREGGKRPVQATTGATP